MSSRPELIRAAGPRSPGTGTPRDAPGAPDLQAPPPGHDHAAPRAHAPATSRWGVLRHTHFRNVWLAAMVSNTGTWMELLGVQMIVAHETGSLRMLGYLGAAQLVPILVLGLFGGLMADRVNRRTLLVVTQAMLMVIAGALAVASALGAAHVPLLMALSVAQGCVMAFNFPAWQVLTPRLVPREELTRAITLHGVQFNLARVVGPALAGVIMSAGGTTPLFVLNTLTFLVVLAVVSRTPDAPPPPKDGSRAWAQIADASAFIFRQRGPLCIFVAMILMSFFAAPLVRMLPLFVIDVYGLPPAPADQAVGALLAILGVGAVVGGLLLKFVPPWYPKHVFIPLALAGSGATITLFAVTTTLWTGYAAMFLVGVFWIWGFNQSWAAMQQVVSDRMRGRIMAITNVAAFGFNALGNIAAGSLGELIAGAADDRALGAHFAVGGLSAALLVSGIVMLVHRVPEVDGLKPGDPSYDRRPGLFSGLTARAHRPRAPHA